MFKFSTLILFKALTKFSRGNVQKYILYQSHISHGWWREKKPKGKYTLIIKIDSHLLFHEFATHTHTQTEYENGISFSTTLILFVNIVKFLTHSQNIADGTTDT